MESRGTGLLIALLVLAGVTGAVLAVEAWGGQGRQRRAEEFQRLVGGLGFGPALDLADCPFGFDPRLDGACGEDRGPVPGGRCFCPRHAGAVLSYPPLGHGLALPVEAAHAPVR
jgi:hypothetical protein